MKPNDLPIVVVPPDLSDDSAANIIEFLLNLTDALERHHAGELLRRKHRNFPPSPPSDTADPLSEDDTPL